MGPPPGIKVLSAIEGGDALLTLIKRGRTSARVIVVALLAAGACALLWAWGLRFLGPDPFSIWLLVGSILLTLYAVFRLRLLSIKVWVQVHDDRIDVLSGAGKGEHLRSLERPGLAQLIVITGRRGYDVIALYPGQDARPVVRACDTLDQARFLAARLNAFLGLDGQAPVQPPEPPPRRPWYLRWHLVDVLMVAVLVAPFVLLARACGERLGEIALSTEPSEMVFTVEAGVPVSFWTEITVHSTEVSLNTLSIDEYPRLVEYVIELEADGQEDVRLVCDPWTTFISSSSGHTTSQRWFEGPMQGCSWTPQRSGDVLVRAWLVEVGTSPGWRVDDMVLVPTR